MCNVSKSGISSSLGTDEGQSDGESLAWAYCTSAAGRSRDGTSVAEGAEVGTGDGDFAGGTGDGDFAGGTGDGLKESGVVHWCLSIGSSRDGIARNLYELIKFWPKHWIKHCLLFIQSPHFRFMLRDELGFGTAHIQEHLTIITFILKLRFQLTKITLLFGGFLPVKYYVNKCLW